MLAECFGVDSVNEEASLAALQDGILGKPVNTLTSDQPSIVITTCTVHESKQQCS